MYMLRLCSENENVTQQVNGADGTADACIFASSPASMIDGAILGIMLKEPFNRSVKKLETLNWGRLA